MPFSDGVRSYLFVPATDAHRVDKALASDAHAVVVDLEDSVPSDAKEAARELVVERLRRPRRQGLQLVRANGLESAYSRNDFIAISGLPIDGIMVPKTEPQQLRVLAPSG